MRALRVKDIMNKHPIAVLPSDSLQECAYLMGEFDIALLPIVSGGTFKGFLTDRDIALCTMAKGKKPKDVKAEDIMKTNVSFIAPTQTLRDAVMIMSCEKLRKLPVLDCDFFEGVISVKDVIRHCSDSEILMLAKSIL